MAYTFLKAQGTELENRCVEEDKIELAEQTSTGSQEAQGEVSAAD